jgi:hypothetical protein
MIELKANETKKLNVALTPIAVPTQITIEGMFITTDVFDPDYNPYYVDVGYYGKLCNKGQAPIQASLYAVQHYTYHLERGNYEIDQEWKEFDFNLAGGETKQILRERWDEPNSPNNSLRWEVRDANGTVLYRTPTVVYNPGNAWYGYGQISWEIRQRLPGYVVMWVTGKALISHCSLHYGTAGDERYEVYEVPSGSTIAHVGLWLLVPVISGQTYWCVMTHNGYVGAPTLRFDFQS